MAAKAAAAPQPLHGGLSKVHAPRKVSKVCFGQKPVVMVRNTRNLEMGEGEREREQERERWVGGWMDNGQKTQSKEQKRLTKPQQRKSAMMFGCKHMAGRLGKKHLLELSDSFYRWAPHKQNRFKRNKEELGTFIVIIFFFCFASLTFFFFLLKNKSQTRFSLKTEKGPRVKSVLFFFLASAGGAATLDCVSRWSTCASPARSLGGRFGAGGCRVVAAAEVGADG